METGKKKSSWAWSWDKISAELCPKSKETGNVRFFSYFTWDYFSKQEKVVVKPPEWKFIAIVARNIPF